jgi:hypothetical protein
MGDIKYSSLKVRERGKTQFYYDDKKVPGIFAGEIPPYNKFTFNLSNLQYPFLNGQWVLGDGSLWYDDTLVIQSGSLPSGEDATYWKRDNLDFYLIYYVATNQWEIFSGITPQAGLQLTTGDTVNEDFNIFQSQNVVNNKVYPLCGLNNGATSGFNITIEYQNAPLLCIPTSPTPTPSITPTNTPSITPTSSITPTGSITPTISITSTPTISVTTSPGSSPTPTNSVTPTPSITPTPTATNIVLPPSTFEFSSTFTGSTEDQFIGQYNYVGIGYYDLNESGTDTIFYSGATPTGELYAYWEKDGSPNRNFHWKNTTLGIFPKWVFENTTTGNGFIDTSWDESNTIETASGIKYLSGGTYGTSTFIYP